MNKDGRWRWFVGLVIGLVFGLATLIGGTMMAILGLVAVGLLSIRPGRTAAIGGVLTGLGACWLALFATAGARCSTSCTFPDLLPWMAASVVMLVTGLGITVLAWSRMGR
jgi:hypothetical protein